jgi:hypothetical protein
LVLSTCAHLPVPPFFDTHSIASGRSVPLVPLALPPVGAPLAMTTKPCEAISLRNFENQAPFPEHAPLPSFVQFRFDLARAYATNPTR